MRETCSSFLFLHLLFKILIRLNCRAQSQWEQSYAILHQSPNSPWVRGISHVRNAIVIPVSVIRTIAGDECHSLATA